MVAESRNFIASMDGGWWAKDKPEAEGGLILNVVSFRRFGMQIYVGKNGQQLGPFSLEEINRKLADGTFAASDLAWYEGAAGWAPLSSVAGVIVPPAAAAAAPTPAATPSPAPVTPAPVSAPVRPNTSIVQPARRPHRALAVTSWVLLGLTFVVSLIPLVGCGAWAIGIPVAIAAIIMGILILNRGATGSGIMVILGGVLIVPLCFVGQFASLALFGSLFDSPKKLVILANLQTIENAKNAFTVQTNAASGTPVTMASLTSYLTGKEIKSIVGETYDPMPVGQTPTATLPANKGLGKFKGGEVLTAEQLQKDLENSFSWTKKTTTLSPATDSPTPAVTPPSSPRASTPPPVTASPKTSASPKASVAPHLISPRQTVEPEDSPSRRPSDSPSSRPSPSAKFAPRTNPRQSPSPSDRNSESDQSGPQQGRQHPRESPGSTPEKSPSDDDE